MDLLLIKKDLETFDDKDLNILSKYYNISNRNKNNLLWLIALEIFSRYKFSKMSSFGKDFLKKIQHSNFRDNLEVVFNLYLVLRGGRRAYLFESANFDSLKEAFDVLRQIKDIFPELKTTLEDKASNRYFIYKDSELEQKLISVRDDPEFDYDVWLGAILEFDCPGDLWRNRDKIRHVIHYNINDVEFYVEICVDSPKLSKLNRWKPLAEEIDYKLTGDIEELIPDNYWYSLIENKNYDELRRHNTELFNWLEGSGWKPLGKLLESNDIDVVYNYILIGLYLIKYGVLDILYPLSVDQANILEKEEEDLLKDAETTPENYMLRLIHNTSIKDIASPEQFEIIEQRIKDAMENYVLNKQ